MFVFKEVDKRFTVKQWEEFDCAIFNSDFWGMSWFKESVGLDGDYMTVEAILRNRFDHSIEKRHRVARRFFSNTALYAAFSQLLNYAGLKNDCNK